MTKYLFLCVFIWSLSSAFAQDPTVKLSPEQIEVLFLKQNLQLMAEQMNIDKADATVLQAKLWNNPNLSVGDVNIWQPGQEKQFSLEISQLIQTANKRAKLMNREKSAKAIALAEFENILLELKKELRQTIQEIICLQSYQNALEAEEKSLTQLIEACRKQQSRDNLSKTELLRLQSSLMELMNEQNENAVAYQEQQKNLKSLLNVQYDIAVAVDNKGNFKSPETLSLISLQEIALENRPDVRREQMQVQYYQKSLVYEKSLKVPDVTFSINYDRYGGVWKNFTGIGVSFDLPFFNRNQGNISVARADIRQSDYLLQQQKTIAQNEVTEAFNVYVQAYRFYQKISENNLSGELDSMLEIYSRKLLSKDISLLEYVDFMNTYKNSKQILFSAEKQLNQSFETLQYAVGTDLK